MKKRLALVPLLALVACQSSPNKEDVTIPSPSTTISINTSPPTTIVIPTTNTTVVPDTIVPTTVATTLPIESTTTATIATSIPVEATLPLATSPQLAEQSDVTVNDSPDPKFSSCAKAKDAGYGPYYKGDPEYRWYTDRDGDGIVCE